MHMPDNMSDIPGCSSDDNESNLCKEVKCTCLTVCRDSPGCLSHDNETNLCKEVKCTCLTVWRESPAVHLMITRPIYAIKDIKSILRYICYNLTSQI